MDKEIIVKTYPPYVNGTKKINLNYNGSHYIKFMSVDNAIKVKVYATIQEIVNSEHLLRDLCYAWFGNGKVLIYLSQLSGVDVYNPYIYVIQVENGILTSKITNQTGEDAEYQWLQINYDKLVDTDAIVPN